VWRDRRWRCAGRGWEVVVQDRRYRYGRVTSIGDSCSDGGVTDGIRTRDLQDHNLAL
jgi:hypothetical protein